jgi:small subunit ribosomal protein S27Ae
VSQDNENKVIKNKSQKKKSALYEIKDGKIKRLRPTCERCGAGTFMADHGNRYTCGQCGFTVYKPTNQNTVK